MGPFTCLVVASALAQGGSGSHLAAAEKMTAELKFAQAAGELEQAWLEAENPRASVLRILELQGIVAASLKQPARAEGYFRKLLTLDPSRELSGDYAPRVMTPFFEARSWAAEHGVLAFTAQKPTATEKTIEAVNATVKSDTFGLAQRVRFHIRPTGGPWNVLEQPLDNGRARARMEAPSVEWWAELLGPHDGQLALIGSEGAPVREEVAAPKAPPDAPVVATRATPKPAPAEVTAPEATRPTQVTRSGGGSGLRTVSIVMGAVGLASLGGGAYFGVRSNQDLSKISNATRDSSGTITGLSQRDAFALNDDSKSSALVANVAMTAGVALVATAGALWWMGGDDTPVALGVSPSGVVVSGTWR